MDINLIAAIGENNVIGKDNKLLWRLSEDMKWFKRQTLNSIVVMGRKTFDSIGKPLPNRINFVLTRKGDFSHADVHVAHSKSELVKMLEVYSDKKIFIIGGSQLYRMFFEDAGRLFLTRVCTSVHGDTFFPEFDQSQWEIEFEECKLKDEKNEYDMVFQIYSRR